VLVRRRGVLAGVAGVVFPVSVEYVVVAGGGAGASAQSTSTRGAGGGGGAGGYRSSVAGESSGGGASAETPLTLSVGTYSITVGAGGPSTTGLEPEKGSPSVFDTITSLGGGGQTGRAGGSTTDDDGGSGAGESDFAGFSATGVGSGAVGQGFPGGPSPSDGRAGGGGGAAEAGNTDGAAEGGDGVQTTINGTATFYAGGGGGGIDGGSNGGQGGGGAGAGYSANGTAGIVNTGGGGGGAATNGAGNFNGGPGGSGIVIFTVPTGAPVSFSVGVTDDGGTTVGSKDVYVVTQAGPTDTVTIG